MLARKRRAFRSLDTLLIKQGGRTSSRQALALAAAVRTWSHITGTPLPDLHPHLDSLTYPFPDPCPMRCRVAHFRCVPGRSRCPTPVVTRGQTAF